MWEYEHQVETSASPAALWRLWADVPGWASWNAGVASAGIDGPFAPGTAFTMVPPEGEPIRMTLTEVTTVHRLEPAGGDRTRVVYRTEITGPAAGTLGPELGPQITADFPDVLAALVRAAQG
jgi:hypothetical protein